MDNPTTLLVAIMYVTIVATGLMAVLMTLSDIVGNKSKSDRLHNAWIVLLLIIYLSFFWETKAILDVEGWDFLSFIAFIAGPIVLLFATNLIVSSTEPGTNEQAVAAYFQQSPRFFALMVLVQAWIVGLDIVFSNVHFDTYLTAAIGLLFICLAISRGYRVHSAGATLVGLAFVSRAFIQAF